MPRTCALIVDDEPDAAWSLRELLLLAGVPEVRTAASVAEAEDQLARGPRPTAVVLDLRLEGQPGETLLGRMRADPHYSAVPVFVVSGDDAALERVRGVVAATFLKPVDPDKLVAALTAVAGR